METTNKDKIAIISDIHANVEYLQKALKFIESYQVDQIICCGDIIGYGSEPNECCEIIRSLGCVTVAGNHEYAVIGKIDFRKKFSVKAASAVIATQKILSKKNYDWIERLPLFHIGDNLTCAHSTLFRPYEWPYLAVGKPPADGPYQDVKESFKRMKGTVCFVGHSHVPAIFWERSAENIEVISPSPVPYALKGRTVVDVGSISAPRVAGNNGCFVIYSRSENLIQFNFFSLA